MHEMPLAPEHANVSCVVSRPVVIDTVAAGRAYQRRFKVPYPLANYPSGRTWARWRVPYQPVVVLVDQQGRIAIRGPAAERKTMAITRTDAHACTPYEDCAAAVPRGTSRAEPRDAPQESSTAS